MTKKLLIIISILGFLDATYLLIIKLTANQALCVPGLGDCWTVNTSSYSEWNGIPLSALGALAYIAILLITIFRTKIDLLRNFGHILTLGIALSGFIFSIYLTYLQFAVIKAICPFCLVSAVTMTTVFVLSIIRYLEIQRQHEQ
ncbi:MAG: hypothetical protein BGO78_15415 [Chloroflexi bacterium 44-23]|nr:MAG: hypothetical protein BGO78_15415 [Chloroflexi bacterium 44-23]